MSQPTPRYTVERIEEIPLPDLSGRITWSTRIHYLLPNGYSGTVVVPARNPSAEEVKVLLDADVARVMGIYGL